MKMVLKEVNKICKLSIPHYKGTCFMIFLNKIEIARYNLFLSLFIFYVCFFIYLNIIF